MILIPLEPNAGPIGGAGLAWPPLHCSFTKPVISFAIFDDLLVQTTFRCLRNYLVSQIPLPMLGSERTYGAAKIGFNAQLENSLTKYFQPLKSSFGSSCQ